MRTPEAAVLLTVAAALYAAILLQPLPWLVGHLTADDMYYYLEIAQHLAEGRGASFDGETLTNGFHPAWALLLAAFSWLSPGVAAETSVRVALGTLALSSLGTAWLTHRILSISCGRIAASLGMLCWLFTPWVMAITLSGVESALAVLGIAFTLDLAQRRVAGDGALRRVATSLSEPPWALPASPERTVRSFAPSSAPAGRCTCAVTTVGGAR